MQSPSLRTIAPAPLRHPHFESFRRRDYERFREEIRAEIRRDDALRAKLAGHRVLESVQ